MDIIQSRKLAVSPLKKARRRNLILIPLSIGMAFVLWYLVARAG